METRKVIAAVLGVHHTNSKVWYWLMRAFAGMLETETDKRIMALLPNAFTAMTIEFQKAHTAPYGAGLLADTVFARFRG